MNNDDFMLTVKHKDKESFILWLSYVQCHQVWFVCQNSRVSEGIIVGSSARIMIYNTPNKQIQLDFSNQYIYLQIGAISWEFLNYGAMGVDFLLQWHNKEIILYILSLTIVTIHINYEYRYINVCLFT